jgi:hypothetical protein
METKLKWEKGFFKSTYEIHSGDKIIGNLKENIWSNAATGELHGKLISFRPRGFFRQKTLIIDPVRNELIGEIDFNAFMTKATIRIGDSIFKWKYDNWLNTKWSIHDSKEIQIHYSGSSLKGKISANVEDNILTLAGLFVINYYWQTTVAFIIAVLLPVWIFWVT